MRGYTPSFEEADKEDKANRVFSREQLDQIDAQERACSKAGCDDEHKCFDN